MSTSDCDDVEIGAAHVLGRVERATAGEDGEPCEQRLLLVGRAGRVLHSIVARRVCWRASASRPPLSRSRRWPSRSRICAGVRTRVRAAASSSASGRSSRRRQSSAIVSSELEPRARPEELDRLLLASGGTGYGTSPSIRSNSRLVTISRSVRAALEQRDRAPAPPRPPARSCRARAAARAHRCTPPDPPSHPASARSSRARARGRERQQADPEDACLERGHKLRGNLESPAASCPTRPGRSA